MGDTNAGLGMVPHKNGCRCDECEIQRLQQEVERLRARLAELPDRWRRDDEVTCYDDCADELEAALKESE